jgi:IS5 family transposase
MRQERTIQATIFEVFAQHSCELKAMSQWLPGQRQLTRLVAGDLRCQGVRETGRHGSPAESVLRCALLKRRRQLSYEELAFHLEDPPRFAPLPVCRCSGRQRSRCCTRRSRRFAPKPGRRLTKPCWPAPNKTGWKVAPRCGSTAR